MRDAYEREQALIHWLRNNARETDLVACLSGQRFVILMPNTDAVGLVGAWRRIRDDLPIAGASIGFASYPDDGSDIPSLLRAAGASPEFLGDMLDSFDSVRSPPVHPEDVRNAA